MASYDEAAQEEARQMAILINEFRVVQIPPPFEAQGRFMIEMHDLDFDPETQDPDEEWGRFYKGETTFATEVAGWARLKSLHARGEI